MVKTHSCGSHGSLGKTYSCCLPNGHCQTVSKYLFYCQRFGLRSFLLKRVTDDTETDNFKMLRITESPAVDRTLNHHPSRLFPTWPQWANPFSYFFRYFLALIVQLRTGGQAWLFRTRKERAQTPTPPTACYIPTHSITANCRATRLQQGVGTTHHMSFSSGLSLVLVTLWKGHHWLDIHDYARFICLCENKGSDLPPGRTHHPSIW